MSRRSVPAPGKVVEVHARLFAADVEQIKRLAAAKGLPSWQIELRLLVRRALRGERKDFFVVKEGNDG